MIFNLKFLEKLTQQISKRNKSQKKKLISEEIKDIQLSEADYVILSKQLYSDFSQYIIENTQNVVRASGTNDQFHYIKSNGVEGIAIDLGRSKFTELQWSIYLQSRVNKLKELRYIKQYAAAETIQQNSDISTDYLHYYKPSFRLSKSLPAEQLYGNITIQLSFLNDQAHRFLIKANTYSDRNYKSPQSFIDLLEQLFDN